MLCTVPSWIMRGSRLYLEGQLSNFIFQGEGWYTDKFGTMLVTLQEPEIDDDFYVCQIFNGFDPRELIQKTLILPSFKI